MSRGRPLEQDEVDEIIRLKRDEDLLPFEIADQVGRSRATVRHILENAGFIVREVRRKEPPVTELEWNKIHEYKGRSFKTPTISEILELPLVEVNQAYGSPSYNYYLNHR